MLKEFYHKCNQSHINIINESKLLNQYYMLCPDPSHHKEHRVIFGTSGHRGSSQRYSFNEAHVLAISQAIVQIRTQYGIHGPCYVGKDTHILSDPAFISVLEVLTANFITVIIQKNNEYTPTPAISHAIVNYNKKQHYFNFSKKADGIILTSSHNPPEDGGIKYSSIFGGPASVSITNQIEHRANKLLIDKLRKVKRISLYHALNSGYIYVYDFIENYVNNLPKIINMHAIRSSGLKLGVDPLSGSSVKYWQNIAQCYQLDLTIINEEVDRTFSFMYNSNNDSISIDCSAEPVIIRALKSSKNFDLFFVNDPDSDRHGIITSCSLMQSNYYFAVVINYLFNHRPLWNKTGISVGKTNVSSTIIDQIVFQLNRCLLEVPVGFKWFSKGLFNSSLGFAGEDSAGASCLDYYCVPWSTDKDGLVLCLLAAEIVAVTDQTLQQHCNQLNKNITLSSYNCIRIAINYAQKFFIINTLFSDIKITELAGDPIIKCVSIIPSNPNKVMSGIKMITQNGWVACRLSGTELVYKIYCESFLGIDHRQHMETEIVTKIYKIIDFEYSGTI